MLTRGLGVVIGAALTISLSTAGLAQASSASAPTLNHPGRSTARVVDAAGSCYQQLDHDAYIYVWSEKFSESELDSFTSRGADDFSLSAPCVVRSIDVLGGYGDGAGPAYSENVVVYEDSHGRPGAVITRQTVVVGSDMSGSFHLTLHRAVPLGPGTYWVSVRANTSYYQGSNWGWEVTNDLTGTGALWKNPGDGFGTGCTTYQPLTACATIDAPDFMFSINHRR